MVEIRRDSPEYEMLVNLAGIERAEQLIKKRQTARDRRSELVSLHYLMTAAPHRHGQTARF